MHLSDSSQASVCVCARPKLPSPVRDHLDRGEGQFITQQPGRDKPHLMKQPGQGRIKSHRAVSCSAICTLPSSPQWVSGTADQTQPLEKPVRHWCCCCCRGRGFFCGNNIGSRRNIPAVWVLAGTISTQDTTVGQ